MAWFIRQAVQGKQLVTVTPGLHTSLHRVSSLPKKIPTASSCPDCHKQSSSASSASVKTGRSSPEFRNIYTFRYIVHTRVLSRLKVYQTLLTLGAMPPAVFLHNTGALSTLDLVTSFGIASVATVMLYVMSDMFRHVVGMISVNKEENVVRISHLTFWGRRRDETFDVSSVVPLSDMSVKADDVYQVIRFYDKPVKFYWFLSHAKNADSQAIERIFGRF
ncbi:hypothetical protein ACOMHN_002066 [Nucella lapillus]